MLNRIGRKCGAMATGWIAGSVIACLASGCGSSDPSDGGNDMDETESPGPTVVNRQPANVWKIRIEGDDASGFGTFDNVFDTTEESSLLEEFFQVTYDTDDDGGTSQIDSHYYVDGLAINFNFELKGAFEEFVPLKAREGDDVVVGTWHSLTTATTVGSATTTSSPWTVVRSLLSTS